MRTARTIACLLLLAVAPSVRSFAAPGQAPITLDRCPATAQAAQAFVDRLAVTGNRDPGHPYRSVEFDPSPLRVLGATPVKVQVGYAEGRLSALEITLPAGGDYEAAFRRQYEASETTCEDGECWWEVPGGEGPQGTLEDAGLNGNADDTLMACNYGVDPA